MLLQADLAVLSGAAAASILPLKQGRSRELLVASCGASVFFAVALIGTLARISFAAPSLNYLLLTLGGASGVWLIRRIRFAWLRRSCLTVCFVTGIALLPISWLDEMEYAPGNVVLATNGLVPGDGRLCRLRDAGGAPFGDHFVEVSLLRPMLHGLMIHTTTINVGDDDVESGPRLDERLCLYALNKA